MQLLAAQALTTVHVVEVLVQHQTPAWQGLVLVGILIAFSQMMAQVEGGLIALQTALVWAMVLKGASLMKVIVSLVTMRASNQFQKTKLALVMEAVRAIGWALSFRLSFL